MIPLPEFRAPQPLRADDDPVDRPTHDPRTEIRAGLALLFVFVFGFLGWSMVARLDSAVHAAGVVRVAGNRQAVQSPAGGVVSALNVHEGSRVKAGDVLVAFATVESLGEERSLASRVIGLQAEIARLDAEAARASAVSAPLAWDTLDPAEREIAARALAAEQANLEARRVLTASERAVLRERVVQQRSQIGGYIQRRRSNLRQSALNTDELAGVTSLFEKGYATKARVLALQRSAASIDGDLGATDAEIARLQAAIGETQLQILQLSDQRANDNAERRRTAQTELQTVLPQWRAAREGIANASAHAPVSGTVMGLASNTVGGIASRGQKLMDIVPDHAALEVEAQVALADANDLHAGQRADIRVGGLRGRALPVLHGVIDRMSADSLTDEHSGRSYFTATIRVSRQQFAAIERQADLGGGVKPGTPVDVVIPLQARTALQFWLGPLVSRFRPAMSEQ